MQLEEAINERADEEMDVSDSDPEQDDIVILSSSTNSSICGSLRKKPRIDEVANLKEENDNLKCQLEAYKNEVDLIRADLKCDNEQRDAQTNVLQQTLLNAQQVTNYLYYMKKNYSSKVCLKESSNRNSTKFILQQLLETTRKLTEKEKVIKELEAKMAVPSDKSAVLSDDSNSGQQSPDTDTETAPPPVSEIRPISISSRDARLIGTLHLTLCKAAS